MAGTMRGGNGVTIRKHEDFAKALEAAKLLADVEVLVGFPQETTDRKPDPEEPEGITNASLGYIHDNGAPEQNIPARPFMTPGILSAEEKLTNKLSQVLQAAVFRGGGPAKVEQGMHQVGLIAKLAIQNKINEGIPPPLSEYTLRERARKGRKGAQEELDRRGQGLDPGLKLAKPLVDTAQMRNAVNYAIRSKKKRKR